MAEEVTTVTVKHGGASHHIKVAAGPDHNEPTLGDMVSVLTQVTGVPPTSQKLVFKGKSLKEMDQTLSALGITDGCKIMLIGKKNCPEEEAELKKLKDIEKTLEQVSKKLQELDSELSGIQKGFLAVDLRMEALSKLEKRVKGAAEQFLRILEEVDAVIVPERFSDCRLKRKGLVKTVQEYLTKCDALENRLNQEVEKTKSKNLALSK